MSWTITGVGVPFDNDAWEYIARVETADGQILEQSVRNAITNFVLGCKADGFWPAIKASCILAGARTLTGALVPLVGTAPTNVDGLFVAGDYNRKTGLAGGGSGSGKILNSNRANNADPQDSNHNAVWVSTADTSGTTSSYMDSGSTTAGANNFGRSSSAANLFLRNRGPVSAIAFSGVGASTGFIAVSRSNSANFTARAAGSNTVFTSASGSSTSGNLIIFGRDSTTSLANARLAFYSIGESLDLALLDARVTALINAFDTAIPS
jgi:hypothetical protein